MAELMIAIIILGLGLLMAATVFPVAWTRTRDLAELTNKATAVEAAQTTVRMLTRTSNLVAPTNTSYVGDVIGAPPTVAADSFVHVLHLENMFVKPNTGGATVWPEQIGDDGTVYVPVFPLLNSDPPGRFVSADPTILSPTAPPMFPSAQVAFGDRLIPPMQRMPLPTDVPTPTVEQIRQWNTQLDSRRFAWSVLHKLDVVPSSAGDIRTFTMYFVTLRRTESTQRFARQDPDPTNPTRTSTPKALLETQDVRFPVPWLVNLQVLGAWDGAGNPLLPAPGVPSEVVANPGNPAPGPPIPNARLIAQIVQPGSFLVDRLTGAMFTVKNKRYTGTSDKYEWTATMTLDREIVLIDVDTDPDGAGPLVPNGTVTLGTEDLRDYWVYPPPVARLAEDRGTPDEMYPPFEGKQPVVGIDTRQMVFTP